MRLFFYTYNSRNALLTFLSFMLERARIISLEWGLRRAGRIDARTDDQYKEHLNAHDEQTVHPAALQGSQAYHQEQIDIIPHWEGTREADLKKKQAGLDSNIQRRKVERKKLEARVAECNGRLKEAESAAEAAYGYKPPARSLVSVSLMAAAPFVLAGMDVPLAYSALEPLGLPPDLLRPLVFLVAIMSAIVGHLSGWLWHTNKKAAIGLASVGWVALVMLAFFRQGSGDEIRKLYGESFPVELVPYFFAFLQSLTLLIAFILSRQICDPLRSAIDRETRSGKIATRTVLRVSQVIHAEERELAMLLPEFARLDIAALSLDGTIRNQSEQMRQVYNQAYVRRRKTGRPAFLSKPFELKTPHELKIIRDRVESRLTGQNDSSQANANQKGYGDE